MIWKCSYIYNCIVHSKLMEVMGSSNFNLSFPTYCHGPGGGGGGGLVWFSTANTPAGVTLNALGGNAGLVFDPASACYNTSWNAQNGT